MQGGKPQNSTRLTVSLSLFQETFFTSTFRNDDFLKNLHYIPTTYEAETFKTDAPRKTEDLIQYSTVSKLYILRNIRWKPAKYRNSFGVTRHFPTTSSQATYDQSSSYSQVNRPSGGQQNPRFISGRSDTIKIYP